MAFLDFLLNDRQKREKAATRIGLESGLFVSCPVCHGVTENRGPGDPRQATEALVTQLFETADPRVALFRGDRELLKQTLAEVARRLPYHCTCESI